VTILFPDGSSWSGASGFADVAAKQPVTPDTAFAYASMSKTFTSALILELAGEGKLTLGRSAASLLPAGLPITLDRKITVAMLLDHTSGLADYFLNPKIDRALQGNPTRAWTPADALRYVGKPLSPPGRAWHYSNTNYLLLGLIAERVTGKPVARSIRERFLEPLGLSDTWYQGPEKSKGPLANGYRVTSTKPTARPKDLSDGSGIAPFRSVVTAAGGAGSIAGTSADIAHWARALYGGDVLGPVGTGLLLSDFNKTKNYVPGVAYGFGVQALSVDGHPSLGHSGRLLGFRGAVRHFPVDGITIAVLTNQSRADPGRDPPLDAQGRRAAPPRQAPAVDEARRLRPTGRVGALARPPPLQWADTARQDDGPVARGYRRVMRALAPTAQTRGLLGSGHADPGRVLYGRGDRRRRRGARGTSARRARGRQQRAHRGRHLASDRRRAVPAQPRADPAARRHPRRDGRRGRGPARSTPSGTTSSWTSGRTASSASWRRCPASIRAARWLAPRASSSSSGTSRSACSPRTAPACRGRWRS
jgi:D-alanyl-D-alanine carboxypeptidase